MESVESVRTVLKYKRNPDEAAWDNATGRLAWITEEP